MLITIHNLPYETRYNDIKSLINTKCGVRDIILDNLLPEGAGKRVTVGVADEGDAAMLVRSLNGVYVKDLQLFVEIVRQRRPEDQPYNNTLSNVGNNSALNVKNNQFQAVAPPSSMSQMYQYPSIQQIMSPQMMATQMRTPQMGPPQMRPPQMGPPQMRPPDMLAPQMVPPPVKLDSYKTTTSMSLNYDKSQNSQVGFGMQQPFSNANTVPTLISYPVKQNLNYGFGIGNQQNSNQGQSWGSFNNNETFNTPRQNDFNSYSSNSQTRFDQVLPGSRSQADNRSNNKVDYREGLKRKRSRSPVGRQSYSRQGDSDWSNKRDSKSDRQHSSNNDQGRSWSYNKYGSRAANSSPRGEDTAASKKSRWNASPAQSSNYNQRDRPRSDYSARSSNYDSAKRAKWSKKDKRDSPPRSRVSNERNPQKRSGTDTKTVNAPIDNNYMNNKDIPTSQLLETDNAVRIRSAKIITRDILTNSTLRKTDGVLDKVLIQMMLRTVRARIFLLTNPLYDLTHEFCFKTYRQKFPESDDQHIYNVIVNRYKRRLRTQTRKDLPLNTDVGTSKPKSEDADVKIKLSTTTTMEKLQSADQGMMSRNSQENASVNTKSELKDTSANAKPSGAKSNTKHPTIQIPAPGMLPKHPHGNKQVFKANKKEAKLQFQEGPSVISGDPTIKGAVENEIGDIDNSLLQIFEEESKTATPMEKIFLDLFEIRSVRRKINEALQVNVLRRLLDTKVKPVLRITGNPKPPNKAALTEFLKDYDVLNLKKSDRNAFYVATCGSYQTFDTLSAMDNVVIDQIHVSFRPMHLGGPPDKKAIRNNNMNSEFAKVYKTLKNLQPIESATDSQNLSDDTNCEQANDVKNDEQILNDESDIKPECADDVKNDNKEPDVKVEESKVLDSGVRDELDWPNETEGEQWTEDIDFKEELKPHVTVDNGTEKRVQSSVDIKNENKDDVEHVGDYQVDDADDINLKDIDDDDLEDY